MPDVDPTQYRLNDLKLRWQQDPSSRLFLQLADEHRKLAQHGQAVAVLEQGLEHRPNDLSALVALGRCRLELEQVEEAVEPLETVLSRDPTHIVASKLLIEAHLQQGEGAKAADRLLTYRLLNDRDPELDHLEYRLQRLLSEHEKEASTVAAGELEGEPDDAAADAVEQASPAVGAGPDVGAETAEMPEIVDTHDEAEGVSAAAVEEAAVEEAASHVGAHGGAPAETATAGTEVPAVADTEATEKPRPGRPAGMDLFDLSGDLPPAPDLGALWEHLARQVPIPVEPFGDLSSLDAAHHWQLLSREGIFASSDAPVAGGNGDAGAAMSTAVAEVEEPGHEASVAESEELPTEPAADEPAVVEPEPVEPAYVEPAAVEPVVEPEPVEPAYVEPAAVEPAYVADEPTFEPAAVEPAVAEPAYVEPAYVEPAYVEPSYVAPDFEASAPTELVAKPPAAETPAVEPPAAAVEAPAMESPPAWTETEQTPPRAADLPAPVAEPEPVAESATATLGELYLKQGHHEEAKRIFHQVLEQDPGNRIALGGLERIEKRRSKPLTAADLLAVRTASGRIPEGLTAKKVLVLGNYVKHLRAAAAQHRRAGGAQSVNHVP